MSPTDKPNPTAGVSPGEQAAMLQRSKEARQHRIEQRRQLGIALENVLGKDAKSRSTDQALVWDFLTSENHGICQSMETNALLIFEGQRRKAAELVILVEQAHEPL